MGIASGDGASQPDWGTVGLALLLVLVGVSVIGALSYAEATSSVTTAEYREYRQGCDDLANETRLVDGGLGMERLPLNRSHVRACRNTTFAEYRHDRYRSMRSTPLNRAQWAWYGGAGLLLTAAGAALLRRQYRVE